MDCWTDVFVLFFIKIYDSIIQKSTMQNNALIQRAIVQELEFLCYSVVMSSLFGTDILF